MTAIAKAMPPDKIVSCRTILVLLALQVFALIPAYKAIADDMDLNANSVQSKLLRAYQNAECERRSRAIACQGAKRRDELDKCNASSLLKEGLSLAARYKEATGKLPPSLNCPEIIKPTTPRKINSI